MKENELSNSLYVVEKYDRSQVQALAQLRNRINMAEAQHYALFIAEMFEEKPQLRALQILNTDDSSDNGRHIALKVRSTLPALTPAQKETMQEWLDEKTDWLNHTLRHRGIYDYIDELLEVKLLRRDTLSQQLAQVFDHTFGEEGLWESLRAQAQGAFLNRHTPPSEITTRPTPRL